MEQRNTELITEELFREVYEFKEPRKRSMKSAFAEACRCTKETAFNLFPFARWIREYSWKNDLLGDIIAGLTVAVMHLPHGLAYAALGKVDPVIGFYMALFPVFIYMFLGTSRHISIGTFAVVCAMVGDVVMKYETYFLISLNNATVSELQNIDRYSNVQIGAALCLMVGIWQTGLGLLKLGFLTVILSESLVSGFTTGAAVHVFSYQLKNLFGINVTSYSGHLKLLNIYVDFFQKILTLNYVTTSISVVSTIILVIFNEGFRPLIQKRFPKNRIPIPIELIVIVAGILVSYFMNLKEKYNVDVVGYIPDGFPFPIIPPLGIWQFLFIDSFLIAIVGLAINLSLAKIFANKGLYTVSSNQEFLAYGIGNIFSSFFRCLPAAASLSRSSIQFSVGGKTQLASLYSIAVITLILLFAGPLFEPVPYSVLSAIVVVTLKSLLLQIFEIRQIWRQNYWNGIVWIGTFLSVIIIDLDVGLGVGILLSIFSIIFASFKFQVSILGRVPTTNLYLDSSYFRSAQPVPNVLILQITGIMNFTNSSSFEKVILKHFHKFLEEGRSKKPNLVLNMSSVTNIDPTSVNSLRQIHKYLKTYNCELYVTDCNINVYRTFEVCNLYRDFPKDQVLASVVDAVEYVTK